MESQQDTNTGTGGTKTRSKLKLLDAVSAVAVLMLIIEFSFFSEGVFGAIALWLLVVVILVAQILKTRLRCPNCGAPAYTPWRYSYRSKVSGKCSSCGEPLP